VPQMVVSSVFMAPAGWIFTLLCVPVAGYYGYYNLWLPWDHLEKKDPKLPEEILPTEIKFMVHLYEVSCFLKIFE